MQVTETPFRLKRLISVSLRKGFKKHKYVDVRTGCRSTRLGALHSVTSVRTTSARPRELCTQCHGYQHTTSAHLEPVGKDHSECLNSQFSVQRKRFTLTCFWRLDSSSVSLINISSVAPSVGLRAGSTRHRGFCPLQVTNRGEDTQQANRRWYLRALCPGRDNNCLHNHKSLTRMCEQDLQPKPPRCYDAFRAGGNSMRNRLRKFCFTGTLACFENYRHKS